MPDSHFISPNLFWTTASFCVLLFLMYKYAFPEVFRLLDERERKIRGDIDEAERSRSEAQRLLAEYEGKLKGAVQEVNAILEEARLQARRVVEEGQKRMEQEAERTMEEARAGIDRERQTALKDIREATVDLTLLAAEKILERTLTDTDHRRFVDQVVQQIAQGRK